MGGCLQVEGRFISLGWIDEKQEVIGKLNIIWT